MHLEQKWTVQRGRVLGPAPFFVIGILNVTPDSFYDGGFFFDRQEAFQRTMTMVHQGADIIDIGGESTRPFSKPLEINKELERVLPLVRDIFAWNPDICLSIDTYKAQVAREVLEEGVSIINDVSACRFDPELKDVLVQYQPGYVLMHSQGKPEDMQKDPKYEDIIHELLSFFEDKLNWLAQAGLAEEHIVLDPGIGFGKKLEHNLSILRHIEQLMVFERPLYIGLSNKSMWKNLLGLSVDARGTASQVATALTARKGVTCHRVHDVEQTRKTLTIVQSLEYNKKPGLTRYSRWIE
jgi:dihydropteroate synthase